MNRGLEGFHTLCTNEETYSRASPEDKLILVCGISQKGGIVGMAGHSISDGIALKRADVGICMGNGCEVAKENSDLILLDS